MPGFPPIPDSHEELEQEVLAAWDAQDTFRASLAAREDAEEFVFYEGPPTANGKPGVHHVLARTIKDAVARYRTMKGYRVPRKAGWDTHGLPVELEAERKLGISGKSEIEQLGIEKFNRICRESVFRYKGDWERLSRRIGYWLDYDSPYATLSPDFVESGWWALAEIEKRGLLYQGYRVVPYCPRCGTGLSSHEVAQGYRGVTEPAVTVKFRLSDDPDGAALLGWTTTPWTLPGNVALAVRPEMTYLRVRVRDGGEPADEGVVSPGRRHDGPGGASPGEVLLMARSLAEETLSHPYEVVGEMRGADLVGQRYEPLFPDALGNATSDTAWTVLGADWVSDGEGTGVVHTAVMYGEDDFALGRQAGLPMRHSVGPDGCFLAAVPGGLAGRAVKDKETERLIRQWLVDRDLLYERRMHVHNYPHCWRCETALLYMARDSWYIRATAVRDRLVELNRQVEWCPPETGRGRMGEWLAGNVDWALSRERYWGTPLPIWLCSVDPGHRQVLGSFRELAELAGELGDDFDPHRPFIDRYSWPCRQKGCGGEMTRIPEVADAWFDSGAMPWAQWHYPFENQDLFQSRFPASYIAEGVDQTRGWFYSLLVLSTILFDRSPFKAAVVNDQVLDAKGHKMSKSRGNAVDPWDAVSMHGADVVRFYFLSASSVWNPTRWDSAAVGETRRKMFSTLRHTYRFFAIYAEAEGWEPAGRSAELTELDRWLLSRLDGLIETVDGACHSYDLTQAARAIQDFVVDDLSNWYVRRSRDRFWATDGGGGDSAAFSTLHAALLAVSRLLAPLAPFVSDWLHRALTGGQSVHLADFPQPAGNADPGLEQRMEDVRRLSALGRAAREEARVRTRQPLGSMVAVAPGGRRLSPSMAAVLAEEVNVKEIVAGDGAAGLLKLSAKPQYNTLGPKHGPRTQAVAAAVRSLPEADLRQLREGRSVAVNVGFAAEIEPEDVVVVETAEAGLAVASDSGYVAALDTTLTPDLEAEGSAREIVNRVQRVRKDAGLDVSDRISLSLAGDPRLEAAATAFSDYIAGETLALEMTVGQSPERAPGRYVVEEAVDGVRLAITMERCATSGKTGSVAK